jgi:hypothetical protein
MHRLCVLLALPALSCLKGQPERKDSPYKIAAEALADSYCALAFSDGCSVPDDCGLPGAFESEPDCDAQITPYLRGCQVPDDEADAIIEQIDACIEALDTATCDQSLCGGGVLDSDPCLGLFESMINYCTFEGL